MATRSMIWVKIRPEDFGKTMICDVDRLHGGLMEFNYPLEEYTIPTPKEDGHGNLWLGAYCHWDGYPSGVGAELKENYNTYEDILNLILLGQLSYICGNVCAYHNWRDEEHKIAVDKNDLPKGSDYIDYTYYFENGEWTFTQWNYNNRVNLYDVYE